MHFSLHEIVAVLGGWSVVLVATSAWVSKLATERLLSKWREQEQASLERLKDALSADRLLLETAIKSSQLGQDASQQKRLAAIERLWIATLKLKSDFSLVVFFFTILMPEEYDAALRGGPLSDLVAKVTDEWVTENMKSVDALEADRPYLGETLWLRFYIYRAFIGRLSVLITMGKANKKIKNWKEDGGVREILSAVLSKEALNAVLALPFPSAAQTALEGVMLEEVSLILSGRRSAVDSFENAKSLRKAVSELTDERARRA
jgi:hypothetical protein